MKTLFCILFALVLFGCGGAEPVPELPVSDDFVCDVACAVIDAEVTPDRCAMLCDKIDAPDLGKAMCQAACVEAIEAGKTECRPICVNVLAKAK